MPDDYEVYEDDYIEDDVYYEDKSDRRRVKRRPQPPAIVQQAFDWGISGSILAILILTTLYLFSPVDFVPDVIPFAGQADDLAAVLAGSGSVGFLTIVRFLLRTRVGRIGCLLAIILTAIAGFAVFWLLMSVFESAV